MVVNITGTNDDPVIGLIAQTNLDEQTDSSDLTASIAVTFTDADLTDVGHSVAITAVDVQGQTIGLNLDNEDLIALINMSNLMKTSGTSSGSFDLDFIADAAAFDYLENADVLTLTYTLEIDDHHGGVTSQTAVFQITGASDFQGM